MRISFYRAGLFLGLFALSACSTARKDGHCLSELGSMEKKLNHSLKLSGKPEGLSPAQITSVIAAKKTQLRECAEKNSNPAARNSGLLSLQFLIAASGSVLKTCVNESTMFPEQDACILDLVRNLRFPAPSGGAAVKVTYPFTFVSNL